MKDNNDEFITNLPKRDEPGLSIFNKEENQSVHHQTTSKLDNEEFITSIPKRDEPGLSLFPMDRNRNQEVKVGYSRTGGVKNLNFGPTVTKKKPNFILRRGMAIILGAAIIAGTYLKLNDMNDKFGQAPYGTEIETSRVIEMSDVDFANLFVVLNENGDVRKITAVAEDLLEDAGAEVVVTSNIDKAKSAVEANSDKTTVVINVDNESNLGGDPIVMTNYDNEDRKKSDLLSYALYSEINSVTDSNYKAGQSAPSGRREATVLEQSFDNSKTATATLAIPSDDPLYDAVANSYGLAIYNATTKYAYTGEKDYPKDIFVRSDYGDTISNFEDKYDYRVHELTEPAKMLYPDIIMKVADIPQEIQKSTQVETPRELTTDHTNTYLTSKTYVVKPGDTLSGIRHDLNDSKIGTSIKDPNNLRAGETLTYTTNQDGPLLVVPNMLNEIQKENVR